MTVRPDANFVKLLTDKPLPKWEKFNTEILPADRFAARRLSDDPNCRNDTSDNELPHLVYDLNDTVDPRFAKSNELKVSRSLQLLMIEFEPATRVKDRVDSAEEILMKFSSDAALDNQQSRKDSELPISKQFRHDKLG
jgi:hypothetical protein